MRPSVLHPLFASVAELKGVGPKIRNLLEKLAGDKVLDLAWHLPHAVIDRRYRPSIAEAEPGRIASFKIVVREHERPPRRGLPWRVRCENETGALWLVYFHGRADWLKKLLPLGSTRFVSGRVEEYRQRLQMTHPDYVLSEADYKARSALEPVYPLTQGLAQTRMLGLMREVMARVPDAMPEWINAEILRAHGWTDWRSALREVHLLDDPKDASALEADSKARARLAFDELLANQLVRHLTRRARARQPGYQVGDGSSPKHDAVVAALPFELTQGQRAALAEIDADLRAPARMHRLLQGDVGCGKTLVAFLAMLKVLDSGAQACFLAPTEILVRQHTQTFNTLAAASGLEAVSLLGATKAAERAAILEKLADGSLPFVIGTHVLFQGAVQFQKLGLVVVDEQHRFGVEQRRALAQADAQSNVLAMTATPIPRSLTLAAFGDMEVSQIKEKPRHRKPVATSVMPQTKLDEVVQRLESFLADDARVYWVCPLVREQAETDLIAAEARAAFLRKSFGERVGLLHGQMRSDEKAAMGARFADGKCQLLVTTSIVEVGMDVGAARVIVIDQAERFGLAQLHQLRGRVGRGAAQGFCLALYGEPLSERARERLQLFRKSQDGFAIAEADLRLRGAGDVLGTRQAGLPLWRLSDLGAHGALLAQADAAARQLLDKDEALQSDAGKAARLLLHLFAHARTLQELD